VDKKFGKAIELANEFHRQFPPNKDVYLYQARACAQLNLSQECLAVLEKATSEGATLKEVSSMRIRAFI
jgi:hypothetical protein